MTDAPAPAPLQPLALLRYERLRPGAVLWPIPGLEATVPFAGRDDLIAMKRAAGRPQDMLDIADLERVRMREEGG